VEPPVAAAGWSFSHGFATLWLTANLQDTLGEDQVAISKQVRRGLATLGELARRQLDQELP